MRGTRVVQIDGRRKTIRDAVGIREKFGVDPPLIPDLLALVGDAADGYPGIAGFGARTAAQLLNRYGPIEKFPSNILGEQRDRALLFKNVATLRTDAPLFENAKTLRWRGATPGILSLGGSDGSAAAARTLRKGCDPMTMSRHATGRKFVMARAPSPAREARALPEFSRGNFADFALFPDDHGQVALTKFDAVLSGGLMMGLGCDACLR